MSYLEFLEAKTPAAKAVGFERDRAALNRRLKTWQKQLVQWALKLGRAALFADCGLGKTFMQLEWLHHVVEQERRVGLVLCPLAVAAQTVREAERFGIPGVKHCRSQDDVMGDTRIIVTNYERLEKFDNDVSGVVLDESSILKAFMSKTKLALIDTFASTPFKLACTATPAPNDVMELGNHCEFLGVMSSHEMLARFFINDTMAMGSYRLKGHAEADFWRWVCSWAACLSTPADLLDEKGRAYSSDGYVLPELLLHEHVIEGPDAPPDEGQLVHVPNLNATTMYAEARRTAADRAVEAASLIAKVPGEPWMIWCNTNFEADELKRVIPDAVEVRGNDTAEWKEKAALWFKGEYEEDCRCGSPSTRGTEGGEAKKTESTDAVATPRATVIPISGASTTASTTDRTPRSSGDSAPQVPPCATSGGDSSTPATQLSESASERRSKRGRKRTQESASPSGSAPTGSRSKTGRASSKSRAASAPSAAVSSSTAAASPSTTATSPSASADCSATTATTPSESSTTTPSSSSAPPCTCGRLTARRPKYLLSKPPIYGFGLNFQHCNRHAYVGLNYSYEEFYQALRRSYRFGQHRDLHAHIIGAKSEAGIRSAIARKQEEHRRLQARMVEVQRELQQEQARGVRQEVGRGHDTTWGGEAWKLHHGDAVECVKMVPSNSIGLQVWSPPFANLYTYSASPRDLGNCGSYEEFFAHFGFMVPELLRITVPGRIACVHVKDLPRYRSSTGASGLRDFPGEFIQAMEAAVGADGSRWVYHSRVTIWKDPVTEMQRTKSHGLLYKTLKADASFSRQGCPDYLLMFRKWTPDEVSAAPVKHDPAEFPLEMWQRYASPVWGEVNQQRVLNVDVAKASEDEKHMCPLQLDVIEACVRLWSNPGDVVFSPFAGIGSEGFAALKLGRRFEGIELKAEYVKWACRNLEAATAQGEFELFPEERKAAANG